MGAYENGSTGVWEHMSTRAWDHRNIWHGEHQSMGSTRAWEHIILETDHSAPAEFPRDSHLTAASTSFNEMLDQSS